MRETDRHELGSGRRFGRALDLSAQRQWHVFAPFCIRIMPGATFAFASAVSCPSFSFFRLNSLIMAHTWTRPDRTGPYSGDLNPGISGGLIAWLPSLHSCCAQEVDAAPARTDVPARSRAAALGQLAETSRAAERRAPPRVTLARAMATLRSETSRGICGAFVMDSPAEDDLVVRMPAPAHPPARPRPDTGVRKSLMRTRASAGACEGEQS